MTDPTHPLFGRRFPVLSISRQPHSPGYVLVVYRDSMRLRIPVPATSLATGQTAPPPHKMHRGSHPGPPHPVQGGRPSCPSHGTVWSGLPQPVKQQIIDDILAIFTEVIHERFRIHHPFHLGRQALVYVRQSSPHQALINQESLKLQYTLQHRARACGWEPTPIQVIDTDLGRTGRTSQGRQGFKNSSPSSIRNRSASSSPMTSPAWPATAPTGINSSTCVAVATASSATRTAFTIPPLPMAD